MTLSWSRVACEACGAIGYGNATCITCLRWLARYYRERLLSRCDLARDLILIRKRIFGDR